MRTWRSPMNAASQGAFVVIPEISLCNISGITKRGLRSNVFPLKRQPLSYVYNAVLSASGLERGLLHALSGRSCFVDYFILQAYLHWVKAVFATNSPCASYTMTLAL